MAEKNQSAVKCVRDIRNFLPAAYRLEKDGRQWRHLCDKRRALAIELATYANPDGSQITTGRDTLAKALNVTSRTINSLLDDLAELGLLENGKLTGFNGTRIRTLNIEAFAARLSDGKSTSSTDGKSTSAEGKSSEPRREIFEPTDGKSSPLCAPKTREDFPLPSLTDRPTNKPTNQPGWVVGSFLEHNGEVLAIRPAETKQFLAAIEQHGEATVRLAWEHYVRTGKYNAGTKFPCYLFFNQLDAYLQWAKEQMQSPGWRKEHDPTYAAQVEASIAAQKKADWEFMNRAPEPEPGASVLEYLAELEHQA